MNECPKYNWTKLTPYEKVGANLMDAIGAQYVVFGSIGGLLMLALVAYLFKNHLIKIVTKREK